MDSLYEAIIREGKEEDIKKRKYNNFLNNNNNYMSNENFLVDLEDSKLKEPKKTFIEEGIMNRDGSVTNKGLEIVTAFILNKYGAEIKKDMVDVVVKNRKNKVKEYDIKF